MKNKGFTLVELAIVIVIIGLLVGGVLQGQELINQAKVRADIKRMMQVKAAAATFYSKYNAVPGDFNKADMMLGTTSANGNGDGAIQQTPINEVSYFWYHLNSSKIMSFTNAYTGAPASVVTTRVLFREGSGAGTKMPNMLAYRGDFYCLEWPTTVFCAPMNGNTITVTGTCGPHNVCATLSPEHTRQIDEKFDDGMANTGRLKATDAYEETGTTALDCENAGVYLNVSEPRCRMMFTLDL